MGGEEKGPTTRKRNIIIIRIKCSQKRGDGDKKGPAKTRARAQGGARRSPQTV